MEIDAHLLKDAAIVYIKHDGLELKVTTRKDESEQYITPRYIITLERWNSEHRQYEPIFEAYR